MQLHKLACSYISLHAVISACMQLHELACSSLSLHAVPWTWSSMSLHEVPWACMQFQQLPCSSFLCLSSSQEFRSACLFWTSNFFSVFSSHCWLLLGLQHKNLLPVLLSKVWHWPLDFLRLGLWRLLWCVCWGLLLWQVHILFTILSYLIPPDLWTILVCTPACGCCFSALYWPPRWLWAPCTSLPRGLLVRFVMWQFCWDLSFCSWYSLPI